jgi:hypothetical protein
MNKSGRNCITHDDASDKKKGARVLESVSKNLDCLFLHLRENPSLCSRSRVTFSFLSSGRGLSPCAEARLVEMLADNLFVGLRQFNREAKGSVAAQGQRGCFRVAPRSCCDPGVIRE